MSCPPEEVQVTEVFTDEVLSTLTTVLNDEKPEGQFLKARNGFTHFKVDRVAETTSGDNKGMVVLVHGLGSSMKMFQKTADTLTTKGFVVLRYDFFGHGYSKHDDTSKRDKDDIWFEYTTDVFVDQLEDLLDYVCREEQVEVSAIVGHSIGGIVAISANHRWSQSTEDSKRNAISKVILINPSIYAKKPLVAKIADSIPGFMTSMFKNIPFTRAAIGDGYLDANKIAFGINPDTKKYNFPESFQKVEDIILRLLGRVKGMNEHPFFAAALVAASSYFIPEKLLPVHRDRLSQLLQMHSVDKKIKTLYLWGDLDVTVPYKENIEEIRKLEEKNKDILTLETLTGFSHECFWEDNAAITQAMLPFLLASN
jgi:pimeloyl-ACP methyl ester carboxylesterase